MAGGRKN